MKALEQARRSVADLHWLATLLTGCRETAAAVAGETLVAADEGSAFFSHWMGAWSRRIVIAKALTAVRREMGASARRTELGRARKSALPLGSWTIDPDTTKADLERALLAIDLFPRAAVLLLLFEGVPLRDAATLLDSDPHLVRKAQANGVRELTMNLARMQGSKSIADKSNVAVRELLHA